MDIEDTRQLLDAVGSFAGERIASCAARPEHPMDITQVEQLGLEAGELGLLAQSTAEAGISIWEHVEDEHAMAFNLGALRHIAGASTGLALAWHRQALARAVAVEMGWTLDSGQLRRAHLIPTGHYGLARISLASWLATGRASPEDHSLLADWLGRNDHATQMYAPSNWRSLIWPVWQRDRISWQHIERSALTVDMGKPQHGLDELRGFTIASRAGATQTADLDADASRSLYIRLLKMEFLGLLAIGAGALDRGQKLARDYATIRKQGGKLIICHPAVQQMLSDIDIALGQADMTLRALARPLAELDLGEIAACRATLSPLLCQAANQVMQVHGGIGYMRDAGPEKLLRDLNMLRLLSGGTREIHLFLAGWKGVLPC